MEIKEGNYLTWNLESIFFSRDVVFVEHEFLYLTEEHTTFSSTEWSPYLADGNEFFSSEN